MQKLRTQANPMKKIMRASATLDPDNRAVLLVDARIPKKPEVFIIDFNVLPIHTQITMKENERWGKTTHERIFVDQNISCPSSSFRIAENMHRMTDVKYCISLI